MDNRNVSISFLGDISLSNKFSSNLFVSIAKYLNESDYVIANLEGPLTNSHLRLDIPCYTSTKYLSEFSDANIKYFCLANNHITDLGEEGIYYTMKTLKQHGYYYFGAGINYNESLEPLILNNEICILAFGSDLIDCKPASKNSYGVAPFKKKLIIEKIKSFKSRYNFLIVILHFGYERDIMPTPYDRNICHNIIDNGADLIVGHHPHYIQGHEIYKGKNIFYSLGNFAFADINTSFINKPWEYEAKIGIILRYDINIGKENNWQILPIKYSLENVSLLGGIEKDEVIDKFILRSMMLQNYNYFSYWKQNSRRKLANPTGIKYFDKLRNYVYKIRYISIKGIKDLVIRYFRFIFDKSA